MSIPALFISDKYLIMIRSQTGRRLPRPVGHSAWVVLQHQFHPPRGNNAADVSEAGWLCVPPWTWTVLSGDVNLQGPALGADAAVGLSPFAREGGEDCDVYQVRFVCLLVA